MVHWFSKERRRYQRRSYSADAYLLIQDKEYVCVVENLSKGGALLSLDVSFPIEIGDLVDIQIPFSNGDRYVKKTAKIMRFSDKNIAIKFMW